MIATVMVGDEAHHGQPPLEERSAVLEIGEDTLFNRAMPGITTQIWTGFNPNNVGRNSYQKLSPRILPSVWRGVRCGPFDLIACHAPVRPFWRRDLSLALNLRRMARLLVLESRRLGTHLARLPTQIPIAAIDLADGAVIAPHNFWLLDKCRCYFKRELTPDIWKVFPPWVLYRCNRAQTALIERNLAKIKPISLGLSVERLEQAPAEALPKTADVFFAGTVGKSTVRSEGLAQIAALKQSGYIVDVPEQPLPLAEFMRRAARAWLVWSPEGAGWDCFRHYEAALVGSVPVMNRASIYRHQPLRHGEHCFYYDVEGDHLTRTIIAALEHRDRLRQMGQAAREHVLAHHTHWQLCRYVLNTCLAPETSDSQ